MTECHCFCPILTNYDMRHPTSFVVVDHIYVCISDYHIEIYRYRPTYFY